MSLLIKFGIRPGFTREELLKIPVPKRGLAVSSQWVGVNHGFLATAIVNRLETKGLGVCHEYWHLNQTHTTLHGIITLQKPSMYEMTGHSLVPEVKFQLGMRHSNNSKHALQFIVGATIQVCTNGMFIGKCRTRARHDMNINLNERLDNVVKEYLKLCNENALPFIHALQQIELTDDNVYVLLFYAFKKGIIAFRYMEDVYNEWMNPTFDAFKPRTAWSLYNAFTAAIKLMGVPVQFDAHAELRLMFDELIRIKTR